jgi:hypothetical protein
MDTNAFNPSIRSNKALQLGKVYFLSDYMISRIWRAPDYRKDFLYTCNVKVTTLASLTDRQAKDVVSVAKIKPMFKYGAFAESYFDVDKVIAAFDYPLKRKCILTIQPMLDFKGMPMVMHIGYFLWQVARAYRDELYVYPQKYGVWGHSLNDLYFERIVLKKISPKRYYGLVEFGS